MLDAQPKPKGRGRKKAVYVTYQLLGESWLNVHGLLQRQQRSPSKVREGGRRGAAQGR